MNPHRFIHSGSRGQGLVEYALILVLVAVPAILLLNLVGKDIQHTFCTITATLNSDPARCTRTDDAGDEGEDSNDDQGDDNASDDNQGDDEPKSGYCKSNYNPLLDLYTVWRYDTGAGTKETASNRKWKASNMLYVDDCSWPDPGDSTAYCLGYFSRTSGYSVNELFSAGRTWPTGVYLDKDTGEANYDRCPGYE